MTNQLTSSEITGQFLIEAMQRLNLSETSTPIESHLSAQQSAWLTRVVEQERRDWRDSVDRYYNTRVKINGRVVADYEVGGNMIQFTPVSFLGEIRPITVK